MKTSFLTLAAAALLLAGCSKEELTENAAEGVSSVATPTNGQARFGNPEGIPEIWFNENQGRMMVQFRGIGVLPENCRPQGRVTYTIMGGEDPDGNATEETVVVEAELSQVGNSKIYRSERNKFLFGQTDHFSIVDVSIDAGTYVEKWEGETLDLQMFLYPSGRTVEQAPKVARLRTRSVTNFDSSHEIRLIIADDPAQEVAQIKFVPNPFYPNPDDPTYAVYPEPSYLEKTHDNTNLGLSRWAGPGRGGAGSSAYFDGAVYLHGSGNYDVDFIAGETNAQILAKYDLTQNEDGTVTSTLSDEPVILGSRLGSTSFGEQWQLEIAIADVGDWVKNVNYVFTTSEGPAPLVAELPMQLTRTEGNLRIYTSPKFSFNGNPTGNDVGGIVYLYGTGTRSTAGTAKQKAELL
ncbi:MAG: hypothetical protein K9J17_12150 [Flavobacteriales bacterium]|nr:hypothetical protein [Flavobacteriales bacterium]